MIAIPCKLHDFVDAMVRATVGAPLKPSPLVVRDDSAWWMLARKDGYADEEPLKTRYI